MSDIYLSITETPTVVTLSAPVVSGALASTVTVANTVTVALDSNSLSALENVTVTVGAAITGTVTVSNFPATQPVSIASVTIGNTVTIAGTVTANPTGTQTIAGTVTANVPVLDQSIRDGILLFNQTEGNIGVAVNYAEPITGTVTIGSLPAISGTVTANVPLVNIQPNVTSGLGVILLTDEGKSVFDNSSSIKATLTTALPAGTNRIGVVTIGAGTVTIGAGTAQIGSVTASISGTVPVSISSVTIGNSVTIGSLPAISGTVTANTFALQGTAVTTSNFTSTTASTVLAGYNGTREVLTIFNEGAGNLHICAGATCTTIAYQVRLSAGDYYEVPNHQTTITHSAVFATAGTARIVQVS